MKGSRPNVETALQELERDYVQLGKEDPFFWTIGDSNQDLDLYFAKGRQQIADILAQFFALGLEPKRNKALDFACGIGRVTRALAERFEEAHGLDISPSMIERAHLYNKGVAGCHFHTHCGERLDLFANSYFDLVLAINVFPYIPAALSKGYVVELLRVLKPGGCLYFQAADAAILRTLFPAGLLNLYRRWRPRKNAWLSRADRHRLSESEVRNIVGDAGGKIHHISNVAKPTLWIERGFYVSKDPSLTNNLPR